MVLTFALLAWAPLAAAPIELGPSGPSPEVLTIRPGTVPYFGNQDQVTHTVVVPSGICSLQLAPGESGSCPDGDGIWYVGRYPYSVDGTTAGSIVVLPLARKVTLERVRHTVTRGARLTLRGELRYASWVPGLGPMPVTVFARPDRSHPFHRLAVVTARVIPPDASVLHWHLSVVPLASGTIYIAEADSQPAAGQLWRRAWSKPLKVVVRATRKIDG